MKTPKKIWKSIAKKFKNSTAAKAKVSSREEANKPLEITIEQQPTVVTAKTTTAKDENSKEICKYSVINIKHKDATHAINKATETDTKLCESEDLQPICESSEEAQNDSTTVEQTSVDRETNEQEPNPAEIELCFTTDEKDKPPTKTTQQRQAILAGSVGAALLVSSVIAYILKMYAIAVVGGVIGLVCVSFALYNIINPNTKLEKVEDIEQSAHPPLKKI